MHLSATGIDKNKTIVEIKYENVVGDLLMIDINNNTGDQSSIFSYWRIKGASGNPPLEIGVNTKTNTIKSITLFIDADCFKELNLPKVQSSEGNIIIGTEIFKKENDYVDVEGSYSVSLFKDMLVCVFDKQIEFIKGFVNGRIEFYTDTNNKLGGFAINNLGEEEVTVINALIQNPKHN